MKIVTELKRCPFCGSNSIVCRDEWSRAFCKECGAQGPAPEWADKGGIAAWNFRSMPITVAAKPLPFFIPKWDRSLVRLCHTSFGGGVDVSGTPGDVADRLEATAALLRKGTKNWSET